MNIGTQINEQRYLEAKRFLTSEMVRIKETKIRSGFLSDAEKSRFKQVARLIRELSKKHKRLADKAIKVSEILGRVRREA